MGYAHSVARLTLHGTSFNQGEEWTTGLFLGFPGSDASSLNQQFADVARDAWKAFFIKADSYIGTAWKFDYAKVSLIGADGRTNPDATVYSNLATPAVGASAGAQQAPQVALVATLTSDRARGLAAKGRMYLPGVNAPLDSSGHISSVNTATIAANLKTFLGALNSSFDQPGLVILASQGRKAPLVGPPVSATVTGLRVGNVYDTQRRRRNQLQESYSVVTL